ncbi:hypothetical protein [Halostreptopolyspora alba]
MAERPGDQYKPASGGHHTPETFHHMVASNEAAARGVRVSFDFPIPDWIPEELRHAVGYVDDQGWCCLADINTAPDDILLPADKVFVPVSTIVEHQWFVEGDLRRVRVVMPPSSSPRPIGRRSSKT